MGMALPIIGTVLGAMGSRSQARDQQRFAEQSMEPRPFDEHVTNAPPEWLQPILEGTLGQAYGLATDPRQAPPLFSDMGRYQSQFQPQPPPPGPRSPEQQEVLEGAYGRNAEAQGRDLSPEERERIEGRVAARRGWDSAPAAGGPGGGGPSGRRGGGGGFGGGGGGFGGGGGGFGGLRGLLMENARGPNADTRFAMDSLQRFMGGQQMQPAIDMQQQLAQNQMDPQNALMQLIQRGMAGGLNQAGPMQQDFSQQLMQRFQTPSSQLAPPVDYGHLQFYNPAGGP